MQRNGGFTLVEIIVVIILVGMIAAVVVPGVMEKFASAKVNTARVQLDTVKRQIELFYFNENRYPKQEEGLAALTRPWASYAGNAYLTYEQTLDPWKNPLVYTVPGPAPRPFNLESLGADGKRGGTGEASDLGVWDEKVKPPQ